MKFLSVLREVKATNFNKEKKSYNEQKMEKF